MWWVGLLFVADFGASQTISYARVSDGNTGQVSFSAWLPRTDEPRWTFAPFSGTMVPPLLADGGKLITATNNSLMWIIDAASGELSSLVKFTAPVELLAAVNGALITVMGATNPVVYSVADGSRLYPFRGGTGRAVRMLSQSGGGNITLARNTLGSGIAASFDGGLSFPWVPLNSACPAGNVVSVVAQAGAEVDFVVSNGQCMSYYSGTDTRKERWAAGAPPTPTLMMTQNAVLAIYARSTPNFVSALNRTDGQELWRLSGCCEGLQQTAVSPDGERLYTVDSTRGAPAIYAVDLVRGMPMWRSTEHVKLARLLVDSADRVFGVFAGEHHQRDQVCWLSGKTGDVRGCQSLPRGCAPATDFILGERALYVACANSTLVALV